MTNSIRRASPATLSLALAILLVGVSQPSIASAQTAEERLTVLEKALADKKSEIVELEGQVQALRRDLGGQTSPSSTGSPNESTKVASTEPICRMESLQDFNRAYQHPSRIALCPVEPTFAGSPQEKARVELAEAEAKRRRDERAKERGKTPEERLAPGLEIRPDETDLARIVSQPLPQRPNQFPGVSTTLQVAGGTKASITYSHPVLYRKWFGSEDSFDAQRPQILSFVGSLSVPVDKGVSNLLSRTDDLDVLPGTTFKLGVDFSSFRRAGKVESYRRMADFLYGAMEACVKAKSVSPKPFPNKTEFYNRYGLKRDDKTREWIIDEGHAAEWAEPCSGRKLMAWLLGSTRNELYPDIVKWDQEALATAYQALFWRPEENAVPDWGAGASIEIGTNDFKFQQGVVAVIKDPKDPTRVILDLNRNEPLAATETKLSREDWKLQGYASYFYRFPRNDYLRPILGVHNEGIRGVFSVSYLSVYDYRPGAKDLSICPVPGEGQDLGKCFSANVEAPVLRDGLVLGAELRTQWINVPVINILGLAPKYSHRPEDHFQTLDVPIYLTSEKGVGTAGVRFTHSWNGEDLLGNPNKKKWDVSLFFSTPLSFLGL